MRTILIDDEPKALQSLESMLELFTDNLDIVGTAQSKKEAIDLILDKKPDLVFLDIELQDGDGFDVLEMFPRREFITIFVTAYDRYALDALRAKAFDYLLKPVDPDDLEVAVDKAQVAFRQNRIDAAQRKLSLRTKDSTVFVSLNEIVRLEADNNYTKIVLKSEKTVLVSKTIKAFEKLLPRSLFVRVHQSHLVNFEEIQRYMRGDNLELEMSNGDKVPLSRSNKHLIESAIETKLLQLE